MTGSLIAPFGMNCGICLAYLREKNHCNGCREWSKNKPEYCRKCIIINCELLNKTDSKFCYDCEKYPCRRLKQLDTRYRTKYNMSMLENLESIRESGLERFMHLEKERWTCPACGATICVHRNFCLNCKEPRSNKNIV
jgi:hypothetical protein